MADQAHKEPTMEEILSSIRKIISEDDAPAGAADDDDTETLTVDDVVVEEADNDDFEELSIDDMVESATAEADEIIDDSIFDDDEEIDLTAAEEAFPEPDEELVVEEEHEIEPEIEAEAEVAEPEPEDVFEEDTTADLAESVADDLESIITNEMEADMAATAKYESTVLTDEATADTAAGSLGKLISTMDFGGENTIEGLVRELLKPMIKDWLDSNLPDIVDAKVEAEVQRIARMAR